MFVCFCVYVPLPEHEAVVHHNRNLLHEVQLGELWSPVLSCKHTKLQITLLKVLFLNFMFLKLFFIIINTSNL